MRFTFATLTIGLLLLSACGSPEVDKEQLIKDYTQVKSGAADPVHGEEAGFWYGPVIGEKANGVGFIRLFEDGASVVTVNLNILPAEKGTHYQAFVTDGVTAFDVGTMNSIIGDARHSVKAVIEDSIAGLLRVEVRLMKDGLLGGELETVAKGTLKKPSAQ